MSQMIVINPEPVDGSATFARASAATAFDSSGTLVSYSADVVRYNWEPGTGVFQGVLWEPARTNMLLNSATLSTQTVSLNAGQAHALSFFGTGSVTISGYTTVDGGAALSNRTVTGLGAVRVVLVFTPVGSGATNITFTVSGGVTRAQVEEGAFATSWIATTGSSATRAAEIFSGDGMFNSTFTDATALYDAGTAYALGDLVRVGNRIYESLQAANTGHDPLAEPDQFVDDPETPVWWLDLRPSNDFAMFDRVQNEASVGDNGFQGFSVYIPATVNGAAVFNCRADTVSIAISNGAGGLATQTVQVRGGVAVFTALDVPGGTAGGAVVSVLATRASGPVTIGEFVCGTQHRIGEVKYGLRYGIIDYSLKKTNRYGSSRFLRGAYAKRVTASLLIDSTTITDGEYDLTNIVQLLEYLRASPTVWIASELPRFAGVGVVYGVYKDFTVSVDYVTHVLCDLEIEGLI